jgi:hypothetical protein
MFNTIRWGLVIIPIQALEVTTLAFVSHQWGNWRHKIGITQRRPEKSPIHAILAIVKPSINSIIISMAIEIPIAIFLSFWGARDFAHFLDQPDEIADVTSYM